MAISRLLLRRGSFHLRSRSFSSSITTTPSQTSPQSHRRPHYFAKPSEYLGSWEPPASPREAEARLDWLRKRYAKKMKEVRRECAYDVEILRAEKERKDEARREVLRVANEQRKAQKAKAAETRAAERKVFEDEFRQMLLKERAQKLEYWRYREELLKKKKSEKKELLRQQTSVWIAEEKLEKRILETIIDSTFL